MSNVKDPRFFALQKKKNGPRDVHRTVPELSLSLASRRCLRRAARPGAASDPRRPAGRIRAMASSPSLSPSSPCSPTRSPLPRPAAVPFTTLPPAIPLASLACLSCFRDPVRRRRAYTHRAELLGL
ncbi:hypothetical protein PVAP13_2KG244816 [Panicum virgatum]|uniref:Uncharacterized protein n=1 Tax=Panicum virgatum TaxID=38727 RepID=A0A8T0W2A7_PANVG|nr:hypothetical protein PVAP13_2KG244816 [Panicum virgatum]